MQTVKFNTFLGQNLREEEYDFFDHEGVTEMDYLTPSKDYRTGKLDAIKDLEKLKIGDAYVYPCHNWDLHAAGKGISDATYNLKRVKWIGGPFEGPGVNLYEKEDPTKRAVMICWTDDDEVEIWISA